ncbi:hypothetical protein BH09PSE4_BH09PSE4_18700 [soil metagenome]
MIHTSPALVPALVIAGSVRPQRIAIEVAQWVAAIGREATGGAFEVLDLRDWPLPMDDEPGMPQSGDYTRENTRAWSQKVAVAPAFVFVTPQYNWGYPAALKNAIDHLYREWAGKPALIVTYGGHGGGKCGEQLGQVLEAVHALPLVTRPALTLPRARIEANSGEIDAAAEFGEHIGELQLAFTEFARALVTLPAR